MSLSLLGQWREWHIFAEPQTLFFALGGLSYRIVADGLREREPEPASGEVVRAFDGTALSTAIGEVRAWQVSLLRMDPDAYHALRSSIVAGRRITITGTLLAGGGILTVTGELQEAVTLRVPNSESIRVRPVLTLTEVAPV